jgi:putative redox protein
MAPSRVPGSPEPTPRTSGHDALPRPRRPGIPRTATGLRGMGCGAAALPASADVHQMDVRFVAGESYEVSVRGHRAQADQPEGAGGQDTAPTPTQLFAASLAACVAFYAGRYLTWHGYSRDGLAVPAGFGITSDRPARVSGIRLTVLPPADLPAGRGRAAR